MRHLRLEFSSFDLTITDAAYEQIVALVEAHQICSRCEKLFTPENPCVAINTCLGCYLRFHHTNTLTFLGMHETGKYGTAYAYIGPRGYVYLSDTHNSIDRLEQNNAATLKQRGFHVPASITLREGERQLHSSYWYIYGEFTTDAVVFLNYHESYGDRFEAVFLATRHGDTVLFNKRKGDHRRLWLEAKTALEATKDASGMYHIGEDRTTYQIEDYHLYRVASRIASAAHEQQKASTLF